MPLSDQFTVSLVGVNVWDEGPQESWRGYGKSSAIWTVLCHWNDRIKLVNGLAGSFGINAGNIYDAVYSASYPAAPGLLFFESIEIVGVMGGGLGTSPLTTSNGIAPIIDGNMAQWRYARCRITFSTLPFVLGTGQTGEWSCDFSGHEISLPQVDALPSTGFNGVSSSSLSPGFMWAWNGGPLNNLYLDPSQFPSLSIPIVTMTYNQYNNSQVPFVAICNSINTVNSTQINIGSVLEGGYSGGLNGIINNPGTPTNFAAIPGSLLFAGAKSTRRNNAAGGYVFDVCYQFLFNPVIPKNTPANGSQGIWNCVMNTKDGNFYPVVNGSGNPPYLSTNLGTLVNTLH
jgi:hypothetical protein